MTDNQNTDIFKIIKRLEMIKSLIFIDEEEEIQIHISKLEQLNIPDSVKQIVILLKQMEYSTAMIEIEDFLNKHKQVAIYIDSEVEGLKLEAKSLEAKLNALSDEKADLEKLIHEFGVRHNKELGEIIIKILRNRKESPKNTSEEKKEAEKDYEEYQEQYENIKKESIADLNEDEVKELKDKYRKASKLCHPDVVSEEQKDLATKIFAELSTAYEKNDLKRVNEILSNLESGNFFVSKSDAIHEKKILKSEIEKLRMKISGLTKEINEIKISETYNTIISIDDWNEYFASTKVKLESQLKGFDNGN
ncbi:MAG: hypothetical protein NTZ19_07170 [Bacteroidetes bacterium]|nr:hypothetical protein [Bacteroidota bacterium]